MGAVWLSLGTASGAVVTYNFTSGFANGGVVPDYDPAGWQNSQSLTVGSGLFLQDVRATLQIADGWNGDLFMTLRHQTAGGTGFTTLLDRVGAASSSDPGYGDPGFGPDALGDPFMFSDAAAYDVHGYQLDAPVYDGSGQLTGIWKPDGSSFTSFHNLDPNGTWTLFVADLGSGDSSTVVNWGLQLEFGSGPQVTTPEPSNAACSLVVALLVAGGLGWHRLRTRRDHPLADVSTRKAD